MRITPDIEKRLEASLLAQRMSFEVRWRIDPIFPVEGWEDIYQDFFMNTALGEHRPTRITLGTYIEMGRTLLTVSKKWGSPAIGWVPQELPKDGSHYHLEKDIRVELYSAVKRQIEEFWGKAGKPPIVALCKETYDVRKAVGIERGKCNC